MSATTDGQYQSLLLSLATCGKTIEQLVEDLRVTASNKCAFCDGIAEFYCDFIHTWDKWDASLLGKRGKTYRHVMSDALPVRCDAPMCAQCRKSKGMIFWSPAMGGPDSVDHCPLHAEMDSAAIPDLPMLSRGEVEAIRLRGWKMKLLQRLTANMEDVT